MPNENLADLCTKINTATIITSGEPLGNLYELVNLNDNHETAKLLINENEILLQKNACLFKNTVELYIAMIQQCNHFFLLGSKDGGTLIPKAILIKYFSKKDVYSIIGSGSFCKYMQISSNSLFKSSIFLHLISRK